MKTPDLQPLASEFKPLENELALWRQAGDRPLFWWRDDDAGEACAELDRLIKFADRLSVQVLLAVIPTRADPSFARMISGVEVLTTCQHGYAHQSHAPQNEKKQELGSHRPLAEVVDQITAGRTLLQDLLEEDRFVACMVPPWNRIAPEVARALPGLGFTALSSHSNKYLALEGVSLVQKNTHVDLMNWKDRRLKSTEDIIGLTVEELVLRRTGTLDRDDPIGLLSHHKDHVVSDFDFFDALLSTLIDHGAKIIDGHALFDGE